MLPKLLFSLANTLTISAAGIIGIGFIIGFHEFGHFIFCKMFKVQTPRFSIGFGPKLLSKKIGETEFTLSAIPLGGYVEMATTSPAGPQDPTLFAQKPFYQKLLIIGGGIAFNMLFAYVVFCMVFLTGIPKSPFLYPINSKPIIISIGKNSPAAKAGLHVGDHIMAINGQKLDNSTEKLHRIIKPLANQETLLSITRNGQEKKIRITLGSRKILGEDLPYLGAAFERISSPGLPFFAAIARGIKLTNTHLINTFKAYRYILVKRDTSSVGGPIMIISETMKGAAKGLKIFLLFLAIISINLAVLNFIPLPILDGGQALLYTIEAVIRRQLPERAKELIFIICWIGMLALLVYLSAKDIWRIAEPWLGTIRTFFGR